MSPMPNTLSLPVAPECDHPAEGEDKAAAKPDPTSASSTQSGASSGGNLTAVLTGYKTLVLEDRPVPEPANGEILVRVMATGM